MALRRLQAISKGKLMNDALEPATSLPPDAAPPVNTPCVRRGYFIIHRSFFEKHISGFSANEWKIYCALVCDGDKKGCSWHSALALARRTGMCRDTTEKALRALVEKGLITRTIRAIRGPITLYAFVLATGADGVLDIHRRQQKKAAVSKKNYGRKNQPSKKADGSMSARAKIDHRTSRKRSFAAE